MFLILQENVEMILFVKTTIEWNKLTESQVQAETITDFSCLT